MCFNCPDFVDMCWEGSCYDPEANPHNQVRKFFLGDVFCEHFQAKYGTTSVDLLDHVQRQHDEECKDKVCEFISFGHSAEEVDQVVAAVKREEGDHGKGRPEPTTLA